jgi:hypothetical protein
MNIREIQKLADNTFIAKCTDGFVYKGEGKLDESGNFLKQGKGSFSLLRKIESNSFEERYEGDWDDDQKNGQGTYRYVTGAEYSGNWRNGLQHGLGTYMFADGSYYEGEWVEHKMHGKGVYVDSKGTRWVGEFRNGTYQSNRQSKLKRESHDAQIIQRYMDQTKKMFQTAITVFTVEKKTMKENSKRLFGADFLDEISQMLESPAVKFEDKKPDVWSIY